MKKTCKPWLLLLAFFLLVNGSCTALESNPEMVLIPAFVSYAASAAEEELFFPLYLFQKAGSRTPFTMAKGLATPSLRLANDAGDMLWVERYNIEEAEAFSSYRVITLNLVFSSEKLLENHPHEYDRLEVYDEKRDDFVSLPLGKLVLKRYSTKPCDYPLTQKESILATSNAQEYPYQITNAGKQSVQDVTLCFAGCDKIYLDEIRGGEEKEGTVTFSNLFPLMICKPILQYTDGMVEKTLFLDICQMGILDISDQTLEVAFSFFATSMKQSCTVP